MHPARLHATARADPSKVNHCNARHKSRKICSASVQAQSTHDPARPPLTSRYGGVMERWAKQNPTNRQLWLRSRSGKAQKLCAGRCPTAAGPFPQLSRGSFAASPCEHIRPGLSLALAVRISLLGRSDQARPERLSGSTGGPACPPLCILLTSRAPGTRSHCSVGACTLCSQRLSCPAVTRVNLRLRHRRRCNDYPPSGLHSTRRTGCGAPASPRWAASRRDPSGTALSRS